jgi:hypothetical protein
MLNKLSKKGLAIVVISFFIGIAVNPALAENESYLNHNHKSEMNCNCQADNDLVFVKLNVMLLRLEIYSKILLVFFKHNSELVENLEKILDVIEINRFSRSPLICEFLESLSVPLIKIKDYIVHLIEVFWDNSIIFGILISYYYKIYDIFEYVNHLYFIYECWW